MDLPLAPWCWRVRHQRRDALYATNGKWECHEWKCDGGDKFVEDDVPCSIARRPTTMRYSMGWEQSGTTTDARCRHRVLSLSSFSSAAGEEAAAARMGAGGCKFGNPRLLRTIIDHYRIRPMESHSSRAIIFKGFDYVDRLLVVEERIARGDR